jgi:hypothetical protein
LALLGGKENCSEVFSLNYLLLLLDLAKTNLDFLNFSCKATKHEFTGSCKIQKVLSIIQEQKINLRSGVKSYIGSIGFNFKPGHSNMNF